MIIASDPLIAVIDFGPAEGFRNPKVITNIHDVLTLPINCVVAGQQKEPVKKAMGLNGAISGPLRGIFGE